MCESIESIKSLIKNEIDIISKKIEKSTNNDIKILILLMDDLARIYDKMEEIEENNQMIEKEHMMRLTFAHELSSICDELKLKASNLMSENINSSYKHENLKMDVCRYKYLSELHYEIYNLYHTTEFNPLIVSMIKNIYINNI